MSDTVPPALTSRILRFRRVRQALALSLLAGVAISAAFLLTPSRFTPAIPGDDALGTLFSGTLKANRDFDVLDPQMTAEKREDAARSVWPVYDYDGNAAALLQRRIADAFAGGREALADWKPKNPAKAARLRPEGKLDLDKLAPGRQLAVGLLGEEVGMGTVRRQLVGVASECFFQGRTQV